MNHDTTIVGRSILAAAIAAVAIAAFPSAARADDDTASASDGTGARVRTVGVGSAFGGGYAAAAGSSGSSAAGPALLLPTLELQFFFPREYSLDVSLPVLNMVVTSAVSGGFVFNMDTYFNVNAGSGKTRLVAGPGLGFAVLNLNDKSAVSVRFPAQLGVEVLSQKRGFGFKFMARPWAEVAVGSAGSATGGGCMGVLEFSGFVTRPAVQETASRE